MADQWLDLQGFTRAPFRGTADPSTLQKVLVLVAPIYFLILSSLVAPIYF